MPRPAASAERAGGLAGSASAIVCALDGGFWCGLTLYPTTKCTPARAVDIVEMVGADRVMVNSAGDWGKSDPLAVPEFIQEMKRRGHPDATIRKVVYENPLSFFRQCARWVDWPRQEAAAPADGNGIAGKSRRAKAVV